MTYQTMPYPPYNNGSWQRAVAPFDDWEIPRPKPWIDGYGASRGLYERWMDGEYGGNPFNPFDPRPFPPYRGRDYGMTSPGPFGGEVNRGRGGGPLNPADFGAATPTQQPRSRFIDQLGHCSATLKRCGERLAQAKSDAERREAAIEGHAAVCYFYGLVAAEGLSPAPSILGESMTRSGSEAGDPCRKAGEYIDRMIEKYDRTGRGLFEDIGEGFDKIGACYGEVRTNMSK